MHAPSNTHHAPQICEAFGANRYPFPDDEARQRSMRVEVAGRVRELQTTVEAGARHRRCGGGGVGRGRAPGTAGGGVGVGVGRGRVGGCGWVGGGWGGWVSGWVGGYRHMQSWTKRSGKGEDWFRAPPPPTVTTAALLLLLLLLLLLPAAHRALLQTLAASLEAWSTQVRGVGVRGTSYCGTVGQRRIVLHRPVPYCTARSTAAGGGGGGGDDGGCITHTCHVCLLCAPSVLPNLF